MDSVNSETNINSVRSETESNNDRGRTRTRTRTRTRNDNGFVIIDVELQIIDFVSIRRNNEINVETRVFEDENLRYIYFL